MTQKHENYDRQDDWNKELGKITVTAETKGDLINFYTAIYHTFLSPTVYMDADSKYKGLDQNVHSAKGFTNYTTFSLWDTYRALHPFFNIIQPKRNREMVNSMLAHYDQSVHKMLPVWSHYANENWCMIGYHSSLGFYPVAPGNDQYSLGSPTIKTAVLKLENGKTLKIEAQNQSDKNVYVQKVLINGKEINENILRTKKL